jgi:tripartite-type tricarboxylate transporter receptor subunit TctC
MRYVLVAAVAALLPAVATAQGGYPAAPVTIIVPMAAGGADTLARIISDRVSKIWGQPVIVVTKAGAGTILGTEAVARAKPDGYTLGMAISALTINPAIRATMPYDTARDIRGVSLLANAAMVVVANVSVPASDVKSFIAHAKTRKSEELSYLTPGIGTLGHISGELFQEAAGIRMLHVPYQESPRAVGDLLAGQGQLFFGLWQSVEPLVRADKVKVLGIFNKARLGDYPNVPTIAETLAGVETISRLGVIAPSGTPQSVIDKVAADFSAIVRSPDVQERIRPFGMEAVGSSPGEYDGVIAKELADWKAVLTRAGVKPN